jgi:cytosine/uracil/thiamine/allantoin permease
VVPALKPLFDYAWFIGFGVSALAYWALMKLSLRA